MTAAKSSMSVRSIVILHCMAEVGARGARDRGEVLQAPIGLCGAGHADELAGLGIKGVCPEQNGSAPVIRLGGDTARMTGARESGQQACASSPVDPSAVMEAGSFGGARGLATSLCSDPPRACDLSRGIPSGDGSAVSHRCRSRCPRPSRGHLGHEGWLPSHRTGIRRLRETARPDEHGSSARMCCVPGPGSEWLGRNEAEHT
jgi:hypothetical protein